MGLLESRAQQPLPNSIAYTSPTFGSNTLLPTDLWRSAANRVQHTGQASTPLSPFLLTSAAEIVARERLVEQLQRELLLISHNLNSNNRLSSGVFQGPITSSEPSETLSSPVTETSSATPPTELSSFEGNQQQEIRESPNQPGTGSRITYFSSLRELLADLLLHNELRLVDNLAISTADNLNNNSSSMVTDNSDSESSSGSNEETSAVASKRPVDKRRVTRSTPIQTFTISETKELKQSFKDLVQDIRLRCGLCNKTAVASPAIPKNIESSPLDRRKKTASYSEPASLSIPHAPLTSALKNREIMSYRTKHCQTMPICSRNYVGGWTKGHRVGLSNKFLPNKRNIVDVVKAKTFCVGYTDDGLGLMTASQDHKIRLYTLQGYQKRYMLRKLLDVPYVGWSILDVVVSPDGRDVIYSTWNEAVFQCNIHDPENTWLPLRMDARDARFALFSIRFNVDGTEVVGGASDEHLYIYNRELGKCVLAMRAHDDDVNAVCFGDQASHIILSGGDDGLCKVWDRRIMGDFAHAKPVGVFAGHRDGIVFIDSRGDDRYLLTNCKDQTVKVWDLRHFGSDSAVHSTKNAVTNQKWDYRWQCSPMDNFMPNNLKDDCSVVTIRGHSVLHTLIRARFSPDYTGKRFIYTGCGRGNCVVYDFLTSETFKVYSGHASVVRDVAWHPYQNEIATSSWDGKIHVWRFDERAKRSINPDSSVIGDEDSHDENYEPIRKRFLDHRRKIVPRKRDNKSLFMGKHSITMALTRQKKAENDASADDEE